MGMYCPLCEQVYMSKFKELDGAYFGSSFPQVFLQSYTSLVPLEPPRAFIPRLYGFRLHKQKSMIARKSEAEQGASSQNAGTKQAERATVQKDQEPQPPEQRAAMGPTGGV